MSTEPEAAETLAIVRESKSIKGTAEAKQAYIEGLRRYRDGDVRSAISYLTTAIDAGIDDFDILYYRGMCYLDIEKWGQASDDFTVLLRMDPKNVDYLFHRGFAEYKNKKYPQAILDFTAIPDGELECAGRWHYMGILFYKNGEYDRAFDCYERALREFPTVPKIWINSGLVLDAMQLHDRAEMAFAAAEKLDPQLKGTKRELQE
jgi:tetratricopeptide (TPR) repeat protein